MKKNGLHVDANGSQRWFKEGKVHREDGPAVIFLDGSQLWYKEGKLHREDGPAAIYASGSEYWYKKGKYHREDGPAITYANGAPCWYKEDVRYSPSAEEINAYEEKMKTKSKVKESNVNSASKKNVLHVDVHGNQRWLKEGKLHREDGPAVIYASGTPQFWYKEDKLHREDGPAATNADGTQYWYKEGKLHREDGPAIIFANGVRHWYKEDVIYNPSAEEVKAYEEKMKGNQVSETNADNYYLVFNPLRDAPTKRHTSLESAEAEAQRIAKKHNEPVYVLKTVCKFAPVIPPIQKTVIV